MGDVESEKITQKINSLNDAKSFEEGHLAQSNKMIAKVDSMGVVDEPNRDFKKNRNLSATSTGTSPSLNINIPSGSFSSQGVSSPTIPPHTAHNNPHMLQPTNNKLNGRDYPETPKSPTLLKVGDDHRLIMEGVKLAM